MKTNVCNQRNRGLTFVELLVIIAIVAFMAMLIYPGGQKAKARALRIQCGSNLKQVGLATRVWAGDHGDKYPWEVVGTNGGTVDFRSGANAWRHFEVMSNELSTPKVLFCPADSEPERNRAGIFTPVSNSWDISFSSNSNISFFIGLDSNESDPQRLLSGDRNLTNGTPIRNGILELTTNNPTGWTAEMHKKVGNLLLSDGSIQQLSQTGIRQAAANATVTTFTNHLLMPILAP
jgi:competence protein ComGC